MEKAELNDILISVIAISLAFSLRGILFGAAPDFKIFPVILVTVGLGFVLHELAHRFVARHYGAVAYYKAWEGGLVLMLMTSLFLGFIFAAPGAVYIYSPYITRKQNGIISLAGPLTNLLLAIVFLVIGLAVGVGVNSANGELLSSLLISYGFQVNVFLGLFNMIPFPPLDGSKVAAWNIAVWGVLFITLLFAFLLSGII